MMSQNLLFRFPVLGALCAALFLGGCMADLKEIRGDIKDTGSRADQALTEITPKNDIATPLVEETTPWFGNRAVPVQTGDLLPDVMEKNDSIVLTFEKPLTLEQVAARIQAATNLRVTVDRAAPPSGGSASSTPGAETGEPVFLPADGMEVTGGRTVWQGKLSNLLDQIGDRFDTEWRFSGNNIRISQQVVRTYMLHALAGSTDVGGSVKTGATGAEGGLPQQSVDSTSKLAVWEEIQKSIETIVSGKARASYSPATGTITIAGYPSAVKAAEEYLRMQNKLRLRRVSIEAQVLSVQLTKAYSNNFDLDVVIKNAFNNNNPFVFSSRAATGTDVGRTIVGGVLQEVPDNIPGTQVVINALSAISNKITVDYSGTLVTLSDQPAPLQVATKRSYVARVSGSATDGASSTTLEPGTIDIGLSMNLMPRVIEQDRVMLRIALGITDLVELREFESGSSTIQLPEVDTTGFLQNAVLRSGETLVLAGFEKKSANDLKSGVGNPSNWLLGGGEDFGNQRQIRVLMITAKILPEEPVDVIRP